MPVNFAPRTPSLLPATSGGTRQNCQRSLVEDYVQVEAATAAEVDNEEQRNDDE